jgi:hypothetical protein
VDYLGTARERLEGGRLRGAVTSQTRSESYTRGRLFQAFSIASLRNRAVLRGAASSAERSSDFQTRVKALRREQEHRHRAANQNVVDLSGAAVDLNAKIVNDCPVPARVMEIDQVRRILLGLLGLREGCVARSRCGSTIVAPHLESSIRLRLRYSVFHHDFSVLFVS